MERAARGGCITSGITGTRTLRFMTIRVITLGQQNLRMEKCIKDRCQEEG